jgi:hypothetical protein
MVEEKWVQLSSWEELVEWIEREGKKIVPEAKPTPKLKRSRKKAPPQSEGLF